MMHDVLRGLRALFAPVVFVIGFVLVIRLPNQNVAETVGTVLTMLGAGIAMGRSLAKTLGDPQVADDALDASLIAAPALVLVAEAGWTPPWYHALAGLPLPIQTLFVCLPVMALVFAPWIYASVRWAIRDRRPARAASTSRSAQR